jgi:hypothetical protein
VDAGFRVQEAIGWLPGTFVVVVVGVAISTAIEGQINWLPILGAEASLLTSYFLRFCGKAIEQYNKHTE